MSTQPTDLQHRDDPSQDVFGVPRNSLDAIFRPKSVAIIGATERLHSVGHSVMSNLISACKGSFPLYPINPKHTQLMGLKAYPGLKDLPEAPDLAVIATPSPTVPGLAEECVKAGVKGIVVLSAGFKEMGPEGVALEARVSGAIQGSGIRLIGPNCLGVMNPHSGLNATFAAATALPGSVAFLSQSGALCTAVLDWSFQANVGFSAFVSTGSMLDVSWGDLIDYFAADSKTGSIVMYMEAIGDARSFLSAAREAALTKPIILIKAGRTPAAAKAASSHTGALAGSDEVLQAAFKRAGVMCVDRIADLFLMSELLSKQPRPRGRRLAIITNAGGPGVLATDALESGEGKLANLSDESRKVLDAVLPPHWSHNNPVDVLGDADAGRYAAAIETMAKDPGNDGLLVILTPQDMTEPQATADRLKAFGQIGKPVLASFMGGAAMEEVRHHLNQAGIPAFSYPDTAVRLFNNMWRYQFNLASLYETPNYAMNEGQPGAVAAQVRKFLEGIRAGGRELLTEVEAKQVLQAYGIPVTPMALALDEDAAVAAARGMGFPVVLKLNSLTITHKTDVGGVKLNLNRPEDVAAAFRQIRDSVEEKAGPGHFQGVSVQPMLKLDGCEIILGSSLDPQVGPVLLFGMGGQLVEVFKDRSLGLPPLTTTLARRMMEQTKIYKALKGVRGRKSVDLAALERLMVRFSWLVAEQPLIKEADVNPLLASAEGILALDGRILLRHPTQDAHLPAGPAIRPYPYQYMSVFTPQEGEELTLRPIRPEDETPMIEFHRGLSEHSVAMRYFASLKLESRVAHERLLRLCFIDYDREMALVADKETSGGGHHIVGVSRLSRRTPLREAEFSLVVRDLWHRRGVGTELLKRLLEVGRKEGIKTVRGYIHHENVGMHKLCKNLGFKIQRAKDERCLEAVIALNP